MRLAIRYANPQAPSPRSGHDAVEPPPQQLSYGKFLVIPPSTNWNHIKELMAAKLQILGTTGEDANRNDGIFNPNHYQVFTMGTVDLCSSPLSHHHHHMDINTNNSSTFDLERAFEVEGIHEMNQQEVYYLVPSLAAATAKAKTPADVPATVTAKEEAVLARSETARAAELVAAAPVETAAGKTRFSRALVAAAKQDDDGEEEGKELSIVDETRAEADAALESVATAHVTVKAAVDDDAPAAPEKCAVTAKDEEEAPADAARAKATRAVRQVSVTRAVAAFVEAALASETEPQTGETLEMFELESYDADDGDEKDEQDKKREESSSSAYHPRQQDTEEQDEAATTTTISTSPTRSSMASSSTRNTNSLAIAATTRSSPTTTALAVYTTPSAPQKRHLVQSNGEIEPLLPRHDVGSFSFSPRRLSGKTGFWRASTPQKGRGRGKHNQSAATPASTTAMTTTCGGTTPIKTTGLARIVQSNGESAAAGPDAVARLSLRRPKSPSRRPRRGGNHKTSHHHTPILSKSTSTYISSSARYDNDNERNAPPRVKQWLGDVCRMNRYSNAAFDDDNDDDTAYEGEGRAHRRPPRTTKRFPTGRSRNPLSFRAS